MIADEITQSSIEIENSIMFNKIQNINTNNKTYNSKHNTFCEEIKNN